MPDSTSLPAPAPVVLLAREFGVARVVLESSVPRAQLLRRRAKKLGVTAAASQAAFAAIAVPMLRAAARRRLEALRDRLGAGEPIPEQAIQRVPSVNAAECIAALRVLAPAVVVLSGTRILSREVLQRIPATFINMHAGITPRYRGTHGAYWAYAEGRPASAGVTVHVVDPGIDTGGIVAQAVIDRTVADNFVTLPYVQLEAGLPLLVDAVRDALAGKLRTVPSLDASTSQLWHHPGILQYVRNWFANGAH